ncbi:MAG: hypothetical protein ACRENE_03090 [Polyangiaceae bacterium]
MLLAFFMRAPSRGQARATEPAIIRNEAPTEDAAGVQPLPRAALPGRIRTYGDQDADTEDMAATEARKVIARSRAAYAACDTYEDDGTIDDAFRGKRTFLDQVVFHTVFAGSNAVRLTYRQLADQYHPEKVTQLVVDDAGAKLMLPWDKRPEGNRSLKGAAVELAGVSKGLTLAILPLLSSDLLPGQTSLDLPKPELVESDNVDGETCDVIEATTRDGTDHVRVFIGRNDSLIHRISTDTVLSADAIRTERANANEVLREAGLDVETDMLGNEPEGLSTFEVTTFHPRCGRPVAPDALRMTDGSL